MNKSFAEKIFKRIISSHHMKNIICLGLLLGLVTTCYCQKEVIDKVIATVGGELVLLSELEEQISLLEAQNGGLPDGARCELMDQILASKLLLNQSKLDSIEVADEEVETQLDARIDRILTFMNNDVKQFEDYYGQTIGEVKAQFREDLRNQILVERMRGQVMATINVTPSEVKAFFNSIPKDSLPYFNSEVEVGEIVYKPKVNAVERQKAIDKLIELKKEIVENGADFAELAAKHSDDGGSARTGGDLGWAKRGRYVPEFEAAAFNLEKEEFSEIVESEFGFHLIQLLERRGNSIRVRHILIKPEITDADLDLARLHLDSVRQLLLNDSLSFSIAVKRYSDEDIQSYNNDGSMVNPETGNTFFEIGDLEPDVYFTIDTMELNDISQPFEFRNQMGEVYYRIVKLNSRTAPHRANLRQDYSKIKQAAIESKQNEFIAEWVAESCLLLQDSLRRSSYSCVIHG
jgi:peptidyl-prolyl cis-trans isomerase SurA